MRTRRGIILFVVAAACALGGCKRGVSSQPVDLTDDDGDGVINSWDNCPDVPNPDQLDFDGNGFGDACELDDDGDLIDDDEDNCPLLPNASQADSDGDGVGDACDTGYDSDGDGVSDLEDNCPGLANPDQANQDNDRFGDACDVDADGDGWVDAFDNCVGIANPDQTDTDRDGIGDPCEDASDSDGDGFADGVDNCPTVSNPRQTDSDQDGFGDACDAGVLDEDDFPGNPIVENNVANDGFGFNRAVGHINSGINLYWDGARGSAIVLYVDEFEILWAHYFDGTSFTPPVEMKSPDQRTVDFTGHDSTDDWYVYFYGARVLFLNTAGHPDPNARARDGDAIILWSRWDYLPPAGADPGTDTNVRLYGTYFDASVADVAFDIAAPTRHYGFETQAQIIDFDNVAPAPVPDDSVSAFGFASDSLAGTHELLGREATGTREWPVPEASGEPTSFVYLLWRKGQRSATSPYSPVERLHAIPFDLAAAGNAMPTQTAVADGELPIPAGSTLDEQIGVGERVVVHDGELFWKGVTTSGSDVLFATRLSATEPASTLELSRGLDVEVPSARDVYSGDHGLLSTYALFLRDQRLWCAKLDLDAAHAAEVQQIDSALGVAVTLDGSVISRTGSWIMPVWRQWVGGFDLLHANAIQTRTPARADARTLASSLAGAMRVTNQAATTSVTSVTLQTELATGTGDPRRSVQSRVNRMNFVFQQRDPDTPEIQALMHNGVIIEPSVSAEARPVARLVITWLLPNGVVDRVHTGYALLGPNGDMLPLVADLGTNDGPPVIYYLRNGNNPLDPTAAGAFEEVRVFGYPAVDLGTPVLVSTDGPTTEHALSQTMAWELGDYSMGGELLRARSAPIDLDVAANPDYRAGALHLFLRESNNLTGGHARLVTRVFRRDLYDPDVPATFLSAHDPPLGETPFVLGEVDGEHMWIPDVATDEGDRPTRHTEFTVVRGDALGVYFRSKQHIYYNEHDGASWSLPAGVEGRAHAFAVSGSDVYVGGSFHDVADIPDADYIARWDGTSWHALEVGLNGGVYALAVSGTDLYAGGTFTDAGGVPEADRIARWDGASWHALGAGVNGTVDTVAVSGSDVYIQGSFTEVAGIPEANKIARWDGTSWHALGTGAPGTIYALAVSGSDVYVGGSFANAGGIAEADNIARWDGANWRALGAGVIGTVYAVAVSGSDVYVAGWFNDAGGIAQADRIARWDGTGWHALGTGLNGPARAIAVSGSDVYVAGDFTKAGGVPGADMIAHWDGTSWHALAAGVRGAEGAVNAVAVSGSDVYVGGSFVDAGGIPEADRVARWDGTAWHAFGMGLNDGAALVDNLAPIFMFPGRSQQVFLFPVRRNSSSDTMTGAVMFFTKAYNYGGDGGLGDRRFYLRVQY